MWIPSFTYILTLIHFSQAFLYGRHIPNGIRAVDFIYSRSAGTWKEIINLQYNWNYYAQYATPNHPFDKEALIAAANGNGLYTARDANGYLLCDRNDNLEIDPEERYCGFNFHEHSGRGVQGISRGQPFTQFWLDDNWLARYMSQAYERPLPNGLVDHPNSFMRWKVIGGDTNNWNPYNSDHFDTLALDGLYYISRRDLDNAIRVWSRSLQKSQAYEDEYQYNYPDVHENYHMGLWKMLTEFLLEERNSVGNDLYGQLVQHAVSLRSHILNNQEMDNYGYLFGWISNIGDPNSLINTEGVSVNSLALGANSKFVFEAAEEPMKMEENKNYIRSVRPYHHVRAVQNVSSPGYLAYGPNFTLARGNYVIQFCLRSPNPDDNLALLDIFDATEQNVVKSHVVNSNEFIHGANQWTLIDIPVEILHDSRDFQFRTYWYGTRTLSLAFVRVK